MKRRNKWITLITAFMVVMLLFTGCGGNAEMPEDNKGYEENAGSGSSNDSFFEGEAPEKEESDEDYC